MTKTEMIDVLFADEHGKLVMKQVPELRPEICVPDPKGESKYYLRTELPYTIYIPGEGMRRLVVHLYKPAPQRAAV